ncbi:hypothetical protein HG537_0E02770 [Torulaspora globosa]|uniref:Abscisic acid G-protein coupled receptor-like domain-containing protein n=1 Tax=Torulaspora globosa TaxID=48254 RepID=A0A7H9HX14_9SACH|nr:hypothetical protein HG537_0E02770 [Torulaspora sp. CBS 2947]
MEELFMVLLLTGSATAIYRWSFTVLWFKVGSLFEIGAESSSKQDVVLPEFAIDDSTFLSKLYSEYSVPSHKVLQAMRILFSTAMVIYTITIEITLWQIKTADVQQTADFITKWVWPLVSMGLSAILILVQPLFIVMSLLNKFFEEKFDLDRLVIISCGIVGLLIMILNYIALGPFYHAESMLTRLSVAGVTIMANLAGVASTSALYSTFWTIKRRFFPKYSTQKNQYFTSSLLWTSDKSLQEQIELYQREIQGSIETLRNMEQYPEEPTDVTKQQLIESIGSLRMDMGKLEERLRLPSHVKFIKKASHVVFLFYCIHKSVTVFTRTIPHLFTASGKDTEWTTDPLAISIANIMDLLLFRFQYQYEIDSLTKQISLILSISLFVCSLSTVATTISFLIAMLPNRIRVLAMYVMQNSTNFEGLPSYNKRSSKRSRQKSPSIIKNLIVSELAGIYVVATLLSIRSNLPFDVSEKVNELLDERFTVANAVIDKWFELIYAISCISTFVCIKLAERTLSPPHSWARTTA